MDANDLPEIDTLWDYENPEVTELRFKDLISIAKSSDKIYYAELLTQLARSQSLQRKFEEAHHVLDKMQRVTRGSHMPVAEIRYLLERGRTFNSANEKERSLPFFKKAYSKALKSDQDFYAIDAAHMLGIASEQKHQLSWNLKAMELAEKSKDPKATNWLGSLYNNIGWVYHDLKEYRKALELFEKALTWRTNQGNKRGIFIAKWTVGRAYRSLNKIDEALQIQNELLEETLQNNLDPSGFVFEELAECLLIKNESQKAMDYFSKAHEILSKNAWLKANEPGRLERMKRLSK